MKRTPPDFTAGELARGYVAHPDLGVQALTGLVLVVPTTLALCDAARSLVELFRDAGRIREQLKARLRAARNDGPPPPGAENDPDETGVDVADAAGETTPTVDDEPLAAVTTLPTIAAEA